MGTFEPSTPVEPSPDQGKAVHDAHDVPLAQPAALRAPTLDEAITAMWGDLLAGTATTCPVCGSEAMQPRHSAGAGVVGGRCGACDSTLA